MGRNLKIDQKPSLSYNDKEPFNFLPCVFCHPRVVKNCPKANFNGIQTR